MLEPIEPIIAPTDLTTPPANPEPTPPQAAPAPPEAPTPEVDLTGDWHAEAGRKGARRIQQLIAAGKLYEKEHGLKRGRQRLRQLIELGKRYEQEHDLRPHRPGKHGARLARVERDELLATLLHCLVRLAKPSFRADLVRLAAALARQDEHAA